MPSSIPSSPLALLPVLSILSWAPFQTPSSAGDWPQWRGPDRTNVSQETGWSAVGSEEPLWLAQIGTGYSSPVIADGRLIVVGYFEGEQVPGEGVDRVSCLDASSGELLWAQSHPALVYDNEHAGGALSTPTVAGDTVYVASRAGELRAYSLEEGELRWEVDLVERDSVVPGRYGIASSPFLHGSQLILNAGRTLAIDRETGATDWISEDHGANYSTVAPILLGDRLGFVVFGEEGLIVLDADTGGTLHTYPFRKGERNVEGATPIVMGERVFISSGYEQGAAIVDFGGEEPELIWRTRRMRNKMAGCTLWDGHFYGFDESMLKCLDLEGAEQWRVRGLGHGALTIVDGHLLVTTSKGELIVAQATPEHFEEQSRRKVMDGGVFWVGPILVDGRIYMRGSLGDLACLDHRGQPGPVEGLAVDRDGAARDLPSPMELVAGHLQACGLNEGQVQGLTMTGKLYVKALGLDDVDALWELDAGGRWHARFGLPPGIGGSIDQVFDGEVGWEINPFRGGATLLDPLMVAELRRLGGPRSLLTPLPPGKEARTVGTEVFHGLLCFRVDVELAKDSVRRVYFDVESGRLHGRTADEESTVLFSDWRKVESRTLPYTRTEFHPESGEERRWKFAQIQLKAPAQETFEIPDAILEKLAEAEESEGNAPGEGD